MTFFHLDDPDEFPLLIRRDVFLDHRLSPAAKAVFAFLAAHLDEADYRTGDPLDDAAEAGIEPAVMDEGIAELTETGYVAWNPETGKFGVHTAPPNRSPSGRPNPPTEASPAVYPTLIYVLTHDQMNALKVGITRVEQQKLRLRQHTRRGWSVYATKEFPDGATAVDTEQRAIQTLRANREPHPFLTPEQMPQGGWSETFSLNKVNPEQAWKEVNKQ